MELMKVNEHGMNYSNLAKKERDALHNLSHERLIKVKPVSKSSRIVIWNSVHYLIECQKQLSEKDAYEKLERNPLEKVTKRINSTT